MILRRNGRRKGSTLRSVVDDDAVGFVEAEVAMKKERLGGRG